MSQFQVGIDVGGTFTDFVLRNLATGEELVKKVPSTPDDPSIAGIDGLRRLCAESGFSIDQITRVLHGTTIATNILLQRNGSNVGLITTEGFRDILHIGRKKRALNFSNYLDVPRQSRPIVPRYLRETVSERVRAPDGRIEIPLDMQGVAAAVDNLVAEGVDAIAVCFLFSFLNPDHENQVKSYIERRYPGLFVTCSHEVTRLHREYERFSTTALNAYVGPQTGRYVDRFNQSLTELGVGSDLRLMSSAGGLVSSRTAKLRPVSLLLSGPVAALKKGVEVGQKAGFPNVITLDVGGTSADIGVAHGGKMRLKHVLDTQMGDFDAMVPMIDLETIGAGGGSIAYIDEGGMFNVGPRSAGARPGPVCYSLGGTEPTVTDALVVLGWFRESVLSGSGIDIDRKAAELAIDEKIAKPLGMGLHQAALGIYQIAAKHMIDAIRVQSISKGYDPREFALIPFGGAGAAFASEIARELQIGKTVVPLFPGVGAAAGLLSSDIRYEHMASLWSDLDTAELKDVAGKYRQLRMAAHAELSADGFPESDMSFLYRADCRYRGQGYELTVDVRPDIEGHGWRNGVAEAFHAEHERLYLRSFPDKPVQLINIRLIGVGAIIQPPGEPAPVAPCQPLQQATADCVFTGPSGPVVIPTSFFQRSTIGSNTKLPGPMVIEQGDATTVVPPGCSLEVDAIGNLIIGYGDGDAQHKDL